MESTTKGLNHEDQPVMGLHRPRLGARRYCEVDGTIMVKSQDVKIVSVP